MAGLGACGGGDGGQGTTAAASVAVNSGNTQVGAAGTALTDSMVVIVRDAAGAVLGGVTVTWAVGAGGGSVSPATSTSAANGLAAARRTLGAAAGAQTATATVTGLSPVTFNAVAQIQGAVNIASGTVGPLTDTTLGSRTLVASVTDQNNGPVQGVAVQWGASGGGSVSAASVATNAAGQSSVTYTYGPTAGAHGATATVTGLVGSPVAFALTGTAGNATQLVKTGGDNVTAAPGGQITLTVTTRDARNNPRNGVTIDWAAASGGGSVNPTQSTSAGSGTATTARTLGGVGPQTTTATAAGIAGAPSVTFASTAAATINVADNSFNPNALSVPAGSDVTWQWVGTTSPHNVTFAAVAGAPANEGNRTSGSALRTFTSQGTFNYQCTNHIGMSGVVTVTP